MVGFSIDLCPRSRTRALALLVVLLYCGHVARGQTGSAYGPAYTPPRAEAYGQYGQYGQTPAGAYQRVTQAPQYDRSTVGSSSTAFPPSRPPLQGPPTIQPAAQAAQPAVEQVVEVRVLGNDRVSLAKILPSIQTRAGRPFDQELLEDDVRRLHRTGWFVRVNPSTQRVPGGRVVLFELLERPIIQYVRYVGNSVNKKHLVKEAEITEGDALMISEVRNARQRIESYYRGKGFPNVRVTIHEGDDHSDRGVIFVINEGRKQKIYRTTFIGNHIASDGRLKTQIESKPGFLYLFKGELDRDKLDSDVDRLVNYYHSLGFFGVEVGREVRQMSFPIPALPSRTPTRPIHVTYVIDEGVRYEIRDISIVGNSRFSTDELLSEFEVESGQPFDRAKLNATVLALKDRYGCIGYAFADVNPEVRFHEKPGALDLVFSVEEGHLCRVGRINVDIRGDNAHTRITTVLNRTSLKPGDIFDIRKLRDSERRYRASNLFRVDPAMGIVPTIVVSPPSPEEIETQLARRRAAIGSVRGQSPDEEEYLIDIDVFHVEQIRPDPMQTGPAYPAAPRPWLAPPAAPGAMPAGSRTEPRTYQQDPSWVIRGQSPDQSISLPSSGWQPLGTGSPESRKTAAPNNGSWNPPRRTNWTPPATSSPARRPRQRTPAWLAGYGGAESLVRGQSEPGFAATAPQTSFGQPVVSSTAQQSFSGSLRDGYSSTSASQGMNGFGPMVGQPMVQAPASYEDPYLGDPQLPPPGSTARPAGYFTDGGLFHEDSFLGHPPSSDPAIFVPLNPTLYETETGRLMFSAGVNSEAGLIGSMIIDEQNFDWRNPPRDWNDIRNFTAFRGGGQRLRLEAVPGTRVQRYMATFSDPYLYDTSIQLNLNGFYYTRRYREYDEQRVGGRIGLGYRLTPDLTCSFAVRAAQINIFDPITTTVPELNEVLGESNLVGFRFQLTHDTRDNQFLATEGHLLEFGFEQVAGDFDYPRANVDFRKYFMLRQRPDGSGRHVLSFKTTMATTGSNTPLYEHYFLGGFSTIRGFDYRGASPRSGNTIIGGHFRLTASAQYMFPITADDMLRGVVFCDTGTVEPSIRDWTDTYRVAPGFGLRITVPGMGPAPIALDFAFPISLEDGDDREVFSFFVGFMN